MYWLCEHYISFCPVLLAEVEGETTVEDWQRAVGVVQARHPLLSVSIRKESGERPYFVPCPEPIRLRVLAMTEVSSLAEAMEKEQQKPFGDGSGVLTRITLFHGKHRSAVLLAKHHATGDGKSNLLVMQDLVAAAAGKDIGPRSSPGPTGDQVLGFEPEPYARTLGDGITFNASSELVAESSKIRLSRLQLKREETLALMQRAKAEATTVHGALVAAFVIAGRRCSEMWRKSSVSCFSSIDLRTMMNLQTTNGVLLTGHRSEVDASLSLAFWEFARWIKNDLRTSQTQEGARRALEQIRYLVSEERTPEQLQAITMSKDVSVDLAVNNYGNYNLRTDFQRLKLRSLSFAGPVAFEAIQNISAITLDEVLDLTHVSMRPFPAFLEDARDILIASSLMKER